MTRPTALALAAALAVTAGGVAAFAQGDVLADQLTTLQLANETVLVVTPDGQVVRRPMRPRGMAEVMQGAQPVAAGTILVMHDGHLYMTPDRPMRNGKMLSQHLAHEPVMR